MLRKIKILFICIFSILLFSCKEIQYVPINNETVIEYRDTTIYVEVPVEVIKEILPDTDTSHLETSLAISEAWVNAGKLNHTLTHKDAKIEQTIPVPEKHTQKDSVIVSIKEVVKEVPVEVEKPLNAWQSFRMSVGTITLIALLLWAVIKILKKYLLKI